MKHWTNLEPMIQQYLHIVDIHQVHLQLDLQASYTKENSQQMTEVGSIYQYFSYEFFETL